MTGIWVRNPDAGGVKIPDRVKARTKRRIERYAEEHYKGKYTRLDIRFRSQFCYIDAYTEPHPVELTGTDETPEERLERLRNIPTHLCRLRYFGDEDAWGFAFYKYSDMKYELSVLDSGDFWGTPEQAFDTASVYLQ